MSMIEVQTKFKTLFPECLPPNKTKIRKKMYERNGTSLNLNKRRSERRITTRTQENMEVVQQVLERNQGRIRARRNELGISPSSFC